MENARYALPELCEKIKNLLICFVCFSVCPAVQAESAGQQRLDQFTGKLSQAKPVNPLSRRLEVKIFVSSCLACIRRIERHLRDTPGVSKVRVSSKDAPVYIIDYDPKNVSEKSLLELMSREGYRTEKVEIRAK